MSKMCQNVTFRQNGVKWLQVQGKVQSGVSKKRSFAQESLSNVLFFMLFGHILFGAITDEINVMVK